MLCVFSLSYCPYLSVSVHPSVITGGLPVSPPASADGSVPTTTTTTTPVVTVTTTDGSGDKAAGAVAIPPAYWKNLPLSIAGLRTCYPTNGAAVVSFERCCVC